LAGVIVAFAVPIVCALTLEPPSSLTEVAVAAPSFQVAQNFAPETRGMTRETIYKGHKIRLSASPGADGAWTGAAEFLDRPAPRIATDEVFPNPDAALSAALSKAMAEIDRERESRGKP
jgi:hypothetical protein